MRRREIDDGSTWQRCPSASSSRDLRRSKDTPIVTYTPGEKSELKAGAPIFISAATKLPDGTLTTPRVNVGRGVAPPM